MLSFFVLAVAGAFASPQLHIDGTKILRADGSEFKVRGVNICSLEWTAVGDHVQESVPTALDKWNANFIRLPMSQDRWFGKAPDSKDDGTSYRAIIDWVVSEVEKRGKYVLLDLHWSDCGRWGQNINQHALPDVNSLKFWKDCAQRYSNRPGVLFDMYNEPNGAPWDTWRNGGPVTETLDGQKVTYQAVGMQTLVEAIRSVGAKNVILAGGLGYASQLDGILAKPLSDKLGHGIVYADHFYPGWGSVEDWEPMIAAAQKKIPLIVGEFGDDWEMNPMDEPSRRVIEILTVLKKHDLNWVAWCMHPAAHPCVITDWTYKPTPYYGQYVFDVLHGVPLPAPVRVKTARDHSVYDGKLENGFQSWGSAKTDFNSTVQHEGRASISVDISNYTPFQLGAMPFDGIAYKSIVMWLNGGNSGGQKLRLSAKVMDTDAGTLELPPLQAGQWTRVEIPFESLGIAEKDHVKSFMLQAASGPNLPTFYVADVMLVGRK